MDRIPPLAWAAIAIILVITIVINFSMFLMLRGNKKPSVRPRPNISMVQNLQRATNVLRDPFAKEREQLNELSDLVGNLPKTPPESAELPPGEEEEKED